MGMENSAHGAPRRGFGYSPTGFRRLTPGLLKVDRAAEGFAGLPDGVTVHGKLLAAFKAAAPRLGLPVASQRAKIPSVSAIFRRLKMGPCVILV